MKNLKKPVFTGYFPKKVPESWDIFTDDVTDIANRLELTFTYGHAAVYESPDYSQPFFGEMTHYSVAVFDVRFFTSDGEEVNINVPEFYVQELESFLRNQNFGR